MKNREKPDFSSKIEIIRANLLKRVYMYVSVNPTDLRRNAMIISVNIIDLKRRCND